MRAKIYEWRDHFYGKSPDNHDAKRLLWLFIPHDDGITPVPVEEAMEEAAVVMDLTMMIRVMTTMTSRTPGRSGKEVMAIGNLVGIRSRTRRQARRSLPAEDGGAEEIGNTGATVLGSMRGSTTMRMLRPQGRGFVRQ